MGEKGPHSRVFAVTLRQLLAFALWTAIVVPASAADTVWSVPQLMARKADWDRFVDSPLRIEGRISTFTKTQLRFIRCDLTFRITEDQARTLSSAKNAEVSGRFARDRDAGKLFFDVAAVKSQPVDGDQFRDREAALKNPRPEDWYALAHWAAERGRFYEDKDLLDASRLCTTRGLALESRELAKDDVDGRFGLAAKVRELDLPPALADELRHEAFRTWWSRATSGNSVRSDDLAALLKRAAVEWPNATSPMTAWPTELQEAYAQDPLGTYRQADDSQRAVLQRLFTGQVQLRQIAATAAPDGRNGVEIAEQIERLVPERRAVAEMYRDQELRYRQSKISTGTRAEALELAAAFRQRKRDDQAVETLRRWLSERAQRLAKTAGAPEHLALADDYWSLLKDEAAAVVHLEAARRLEPESEDVQSRYRELGYEWNGDRWAKPTAATATTSPTLPAAPKSLAIGLTAAEVRQIQGGPTRIATVVSAQAVDEFWIYGKGNASRLVVQLSRRLHQSEPKVVRIYQR